MALFEDLERVKLRFISVCESLVDRAELLEENFQQILVLLDAMDEHDEQYINEQLNALTDGKLDLLFWDQELFPGK